MGVRDTTTSAEASTSAPEPQKPRRIFALVGAPNASAPREAPSAAELRHPDSDQRAAA